MYKIYGTFPYKGTLKDSRTGNIREYEKIILVVSENGGYPRIMSVDTAVYEDAHKRLGNLAGKNVKILGSYAFNRFKVEKIEE